MDQEVSKSMANLNINVREQADRLFQAGFFMLNGRKKSIGKAIKCIQKAISLDNSDYRYWQFLGEAYYHRGSLNPAINCFTKSIALMEQQEFSPRIKTDIMYSKMRVSEIQLMVGQFDFALAGYKDIIDIDPENVAALYGLAKTELMLARNDLSIDSVETGDEHCINALKYALRSVSLKPNLCLSWKLAADCCLIKLAYGKKDSSKDIVELAGNSNNPSIQLDRLQFAEFAEQLLCKALTIKSFKQSCCLWHNLGIAIQFKSGSIDNPKTRSDCLHQSFKCILRAFQLDRHNSQVMNSLAVVAAHLKQFNLAQHLLIASIKSNLSTSEVQFSNLGCILLEKGKRDLASIAFQRSQAEEPLYNKSKLGRALTGQA